MIEGQPRLFRVVVITIRDLWRGYSDQDVANSQRIYCGQITLEDRQAYKDRRFQALYASVSSTRVSFDCGVQLLPSSYVQEVMAIHTMPDGEVDIALIAQASRSLVNWRIKI